jgi:phosphoribosylformylglycinamidine cyclo-ligase
MAKPLTYRSAGVDIDEGDRLVEMIKPIAAATNRKGVIGSIGGFGALFSAKFKGMKDPVLVSGTDGVGTKLKVAFLADKHDTIGIDLVAMCVNDIVVSGAEPLFFLDYFATGKLSADVGREVVSGIARGCRLAGCALVGGETAELPGFYKDGEYDLAGFAVGVVDRKKIIDGSRVRPGDAVIGLASSGLHSNGYSLARKAIFDRLGLGVSDTLPGSKKTVKEALLEPTAIYVKPMLALGRAVSIKGMAHITGGGMSENIPRVLPKGTKAVIRKGSWEVPHVFKVIKEAGGVETGEMMRTFNAGIGMVVMVRKGDEKTALRKLKAMRVKAWPIGEIAKRGRKDESVEFS